MSDEASPRPWRVGESASGTMSCIHAANGEHIASCFGILSEADAALIVAAVNKHGMPITELVKGYGELEAERDRLRDIVRRLVYLSESLLANYEYRYREDVNSMAFVENTRGFLREARAAIGEGETPTGKGVGR